MGRYLLKAGQHIMADKSQPPRKIKDAAGNEIERHLSKTIKAGQTVDSDEDLVLLQGSDRWERTDGGSASDAARIRELEAEIAKLKSGASDSGRTPGDPLPEIAATSPSVAPGGQVSTGYQETRAGVTGPMLPEDVKAGGAGKAAPPSQRDYDKEYGDLDSMTVADLKDLAASEEIELHGAHKKEEIIKAIRGK